jgi:hypothetical protein
MAVTEDLTTHSNSSNSIHSTDLELRAQVDLAAVIPVVVILEPVIQVAVTHTSSILDIIMVLLEVLRDIRQILVIIQAPRQ